MFSKIEASRWDTRCNANARQLGICYWVYYYLRCMCPPCESHPPAVRQKVVQVGRGGSTQNGHFRLEKHVFMKNFIKLKRFAVFFYTFPLIFVGIAKKKFFFHKHTVHCTQWPQTALITWTILPLKHISMKNVLYKKIRRIFLHISSNFRENCLTFLLMLLILTWRSNICAS